MIARIVPGPLRGSIAAIPSKSEAHRLLICAALADAPTRIPLSASSQDIDATIRCLNAMGADISLANGELRVTPITDPPAHCEADCGESGSTLRFLLPVAGALGIEVDFRMHGRLPERPIAPLDRELVRGGCKLTRPERDVLRISGKLQPGSYSLPGDVSSQYITGMLLALTLLDGESSLSITGRLESASYIGITRRCMASFGANPFPTDGGYRIPGMGRYVSPGRMQIGGDWSNAAFWLCVSELPGCKVEVTGLDPDSAQGDKRIVSALAELRTSEGECVLDAGDIPDLVPTIAACACAAGRALRVTHAERLRIKESDRIATVRQALNALGGNVSETPDGLIVRRRKPTGGTVDAAGDHRIAMMAAVASAGCTREVVIRGAEAVNKSYPGFWRDFASLGGRVELTEG
ncbi:MAG: 3-phosphoshikimate 1-carboxyvinyltransferase [Aristaeellaceae bacterium]